MRFSPLGLFVLVLGFVSVPSFARQSGTPPQTPDGPTSEKAQKSYKEGLELERKHVYLFALDSFKKADKQDEGRCLACQMKMIKYGTQLQEWKTAQTAATEMIAQAQGEKNIAIAHYQAGSVAFTEALARNKSDLYSKAHEEFTQALAAFSNFPAALLDDGRALAHLNQDAAARADFEKYLDLHSADDPERRRAQRFIDEPELARARMVPPFAVDTLSGEHVSMDDLAGKVVLLDFWATWCGPCREALPHMQEIVKKFQGQPLVVLSVSLDSDEQKWKDFISKNRMTWLHYRDGGFTGPIATLFGVKAIPQTFTIDADGVLQDQHIGDAAIEGKLKKLVARAVDLQGPGKPLQ
jgi:thiol-disulfide isomerase/thioredoxin